MRTENKIQLNLNLRKIRDIRNFCCLPIFYYIASPNTRNFWKSQVWIYKNFLAKIPNLPGHKEKNPIVYSNKTTRQWTIFLTISPLKFVARWGKSAKLYYGLLPVHGYEHIKSGVLIHFHAFSFSAVRKSNIQCIQKQHKTVFYCFPWFYEGFVLSINLKKISI